MARFLASLDAVERVLIALLTGTALLLACLSMTVRYVLPGLNLDWTFELTIFTTIWATFLAGARIAGEGGHVRVDTLLTYLPNRVCIALAVLAGVTGIAVALFLAWSGWIVVKEAFLWDERTTSTLRLPLWIYYLSLPVGAALIAFHLAVRTVFIVNGRVRDDVGQHEH